MHCAHMVEVLCLEVEVDTCPNYALFIKETADDIDDDVVSGFNTHHTKLKDDDNERK